MTRDDAIKTIAKTLAEDAECPTIGHDALAAKIAKALERDGVYLGPAEPYWRADDREKASEMRRWRHRRKPWR